MKLTPNQLDMEMKQVPGWLMNSAGEIEKTFTLAGFPQAMMFVQAVGFLSESKNHHPDILIQWNKVRLSLTTHDAGGLTSKDFELAKMIDNLGIR